MSHTPFLTDNQGSVQYESDSNNLQRKNGPSYVGYSGYIVYEYKDFFHREDGPADYCAANGASNYYLEGCVIKPETYWSTRIGAAV